MYQQRPCVSPLLYLPVSLALEETCMIWGLLLGTGDAQREGKWEVGSRDGAWVSKAMLPQHAVGFVWP